GRLYLGLYLWRPGRGRCPAPDPGSHHPDGWLHAKPEGGSPDGVLHLRTDVPAPGRDHGVHPVFPGIPERAPNGRRPGKTGIRAAAGTIFFRKETDLWIVSLGYLPY